MTEELDPNEYEIWWCEDQELGWEVDEEDERTLRCVDVGRCHEKIWHSHCGRRTVLRSLD